MKSKVIVVLLVLNINGILAQSLIPRELLRAVERKTRTLKGVPGERYFQNHADYTIDAVFDPFTGLLKGESEILYYNESPDSLFNLVLRIYQDIHKKGGIRDMEVNPEVIHDGVKINSLKIDGEDFLDLNHKTYREGTNLIIFTPRGIAPNSSSKINISWQFNVPMMAVPRFGRYDEGSFFISMWYPQVAVYDDIDGWDILNYNGTQEFYNDFNNYYVSISVPRGFMVWSTGLWTNPEYILSEEKYKLLLEASGTDKLVHIITASDLKNQSWYVGKGHKVFRYRAENIPDFAFGVSNRYLWDVCTAWVQSENTEQKILVSAAYPEGAPHFNEVAEMGQKIVKHFSEVSYGIPYPYPAVTVFNGGGGMEYPMIVNNGARPTTEGTSFLTIHELAHAYFPFYLGINERNYAWIDEGLTSFIPCETDKAMHNFQPLEKLVSNFNTFSGTSGDMPVSAPSYLLKHDEYRNCSYTKSAVAFSMLQKYLGTDTFKMAIKNFAEIWQYKHPLPYDLFAVFEDVSNKDLHWFIDEWFYGNGIPDLGIGNVAQTGNSLKINVINKGTLPVPVILEIQYLNEEKEIYEVSPEVWRDVDKLDLSFIIADELKSIRLGTKEIPDLDLTDNEFIISEEP